MKVQWDIAAFKQFEKQLSSTYEVDTALLTATQEIAKVLHRELLNRTPVLTGNLRKMWSAGDNLRFTVERVGDNFQVTLVNTARNPQGEMYGLAVNDGYTLKNGNFKEGRFFVETSMNVTKEEIEEIVMKELQKWWSGV